MGDFSRVPQTGRSKTQILAWPRAAAPPTGTALSLVGPCPGPGGMFMVAPLPSNPPDAKSIHHSALIRQPDAAKRSLAENWCHGCPSVPSSSAGHRAPDRCYRDGWLHGQGSTGPLCCHCPSVLCHPALQGYPRAPPQQQAPMHTGSARELRPPRPQVPHSTGGWGRKADRWGPG